MPKRKTAPKEQPHKELIFKGKYNDFKDFYDINKETIYKSIIEIFEDFNQLKNTKELSLRIAAKIKGLEWDTKFDFKRVESIVLTRDIIPYFEEIEDYETCRHVHKLHKELTN